MQGLNLIVKPLQPTKKPAEASFFKWQSPPALIPPGEFFLGRSRSYRFSAPPAAGR